MLFVLQLPWLATARSEASPEFTIAYQTFAAALKTNDLDATLNRCTEAQDIAVQHLGDGDRRTADLSYDCGALFNKVGRKPSAIAMLQQAIAQQEKAYGPEAVELIRVLMAFGATRMTDWPEREQALRCNSCPCSINTLSAPHIPCHGPGVPGVGRKS